MLDKIKSHFEANKKAYLGAAIGVIVGTAGTILLSKSTTIVNARPVQVLTWKSKQTIEVFVEALGDPGNVIQDITTGTIYASQGQAARELRVSPARISENLAGKLADVKGHTFEKLGKAKVSE